MVQCRFFPVWKYQWFHDWLRNFPGKREWERSRKVVVFSDTSVLNVLQDWPMAANDSVLGEMVRVLDTGMFPGSNAIFKWITGHSGISSHVKADTLAYPSMDH